MDKDNTLLNLLHKPSLSDRVTLTNPLAHFGEDAPCSLMRESQSHHRANSSSWEVDVHHTACLKGLLLLAGTICNGFQHGLFLTGQEEGGRASSLCDK